MTAIPHTGVWLFPESDARRLTDLIVRAEDLGVDEVWLGDEGPAREPFSVLAAAARATSRIRLAVGITNPYVRHPALAATTALTLQELSGGRFTLGVGTGGQMSLGPFRLTADSPIPRVRRFIDTYRAVCERRPASDYEPPDIAVDATGRFGAPPLFVGGRGPRINELASEVADGAFVAGLPPFRYDDVIGSARSRRQIDIALYPSVAFDPSGADDHRPEMIWALLDAPAKVSAALGVDRAQLVAAAAALRQGDADPARDVVTDDLLTELMFVDPPPVVGHRLADLVERFKPASIGLALLQSDLEAGIADAAAAFATMRSQLSHTHP